MLLSSKQKDELLEKIKQIPLSNSTATRRSEILAKDVQSKLDAAMKSAPCIGHADKSTDMIMPRFSREDFCEDLLDMTA